MASCIWDIINHLNPQVKDAIPGSVICRVLVDQHQHPFVVKKGIKRKFKTFAVCLHPAASVKFEGNKCVPCRYGRKYCID